MLGLGLGVLGGRETAAAAGTLEEPTAVSSLPAAPQTAAVAPGAASQASLASPVAPGRAAAGSTLLLPSTSGLSADTPVAQGSVPASGRVAAEPTGVAPSFLQGQGVGAAGATAEAISPSSAAAPLQATPGAGSDTSVASPSGADLAPEPPAPGTKPAKPAKPDTRRAAVLPGLPLDLELRADQQGYDAQLRRFVGTGNVTALVAGARLMAERIEVDTESRTVYAFGKVRFQRGQQYLQASRLRYSLLEGRGEMQDVYGVLDLDGSATDLDLGQAPSTPLPSPEAMSCPPALPPPPEWHPYPWAATAWAGQMFAANFGDTFIFKGRLRPEYLVGFGLQRRLINAGPLTLELDANLLGHRADQQAGGPYNQAVPFADTPSQTFADLTVGVGGRLWLQPWLNLYFVEGISLLSQPSNYEKTFRENYSIFLNYLAFEVEALVNPQLSVVGRIHHRSGAYGVYFGVSEGSNAYLLGLRYRWGQSKPLVPPLELPPAQGCPGAPAPGLEGPQGLSEQLQAVTLGVPSLGASAAPTSAPAAPAVAATPGNAWARARAQERLRREAIARIDQRVQDVQFEQSLIAERRRGLPTRTPETDTASRFGGIRPDQLYSLNSRTTRQLLRGTISRWRMQARLLRFTPNTFSGDRVAFTNDPFTPAQSWMDSTDVVATLKPNGDTVIKAARNRLRLEDRLSLAVTRQTTIKKEQVDNRVVIGYDLTDRDGYYVGYTIPMTLGEKLNLSFEPQFLAQRAINGTTDSYPKPGQSVAAPVVSQPATTGDLFGLVARLNGPLLGFDVDGTLDMSTFNSENIADGTRSWGSLDRSFTMPWLGPSVARLFGAYRYQIWNGSLGQQDVYTAYGVSLENKRELPLWGRISSDYYWRIGVGNYQGNPVDSVNIDQIWRGNAIGSFNVSVPLWIGKPAPLTPLAGLQNTAIPIVPGFSLDANVLGTLAYYGDGTNQNTITLSGGPTLTLGHFVRPFLDYTRVTITGSGTLRQGVSPFGFDRAVDLGTLGIGLTQQIVGPLVFNGGIGFNISPSSQYYGDVTASYVELRWQRRAYEVGIFYSPYQGIGGVRLKLNDFNFNGPGVPFVPLNPAAAVLDRPF